MTECMQTLSSLAPTDPCPTCGAPAIDHIRWRRGKAREANITLEAWEAKHWDNGGVTEEVQELADAIRDGRDQGDERPMQPKHPATTQYLDHGELAKSLGVDDASPQYHLRAISDPFEVSLFNVLETAQFRALGLHEKWGPFASLHEVESVIHEEYDELKREVFREKKRRKRVKAELLDIITAAARAWAELDQGEPLSDLKASKKRAKALAK